MTAAKLLDALARFPGYTGENADARKAYTQCLLSEGNTETWVQLPRDRWPDAWFEDGSKRQIPMYVDPVVRLLRNLYGHPLAGLWWERHCHARILSCGFQPVQGWECLYVHPVKKAWLSVYGDDLKLACRECDKEGIWKD